MKETEAIISEYGLFTDSVANGSKIRIKDLFNSGFYEDSTLEESFTDIFGHSAHLLVQDAVLFADKFQIPAKYKPLLIYFEHFVAIELNGKTNDFVILFDHASFNVSQKYIAQSPLFNVDFLANDSKFQLINQFSLEGGLDYAFDCLIVLARELNIETFFVNELFILKRNLLNSLDHYYFKNR